MKIALVTYPAEPKLYAEEKQLPALFAERGVDAEVVAWSDPAVDWSRYRALVLRNTWDYFERLPEFLRWLDRLEAIGARLINPISLVRWNLDKRYLPELEGKGVPILPARFHPRGSAVKLVDEVRTLGASELVLKPAISGGAFRTHRFTAERAEALQPEAEAILVGCGLIVQPFAPEIVDEGEYSFFFFGGRFSHAVVKRPAKGDYRVQPMFQGTFAQVRPTQALIAQAAAVLPALPEPAVYARIDGLRRGDAFLLMEAELIEPYLFLGEDREAAKRYVEAVAAAVASV